MTHRRLTPLVLLLIQGAILPLASQGSNRAPAKQFALPGEVGLVEMLGDGHYRIHRGGQVSEKLQAKSLIQLRKAIIDPLSPVAMAPAANQRRAKQAEAFRGQAFLVQFHTQALPEYQREIARLGGACHAPVPDQAMVVLMNASTRTKVEKLPFVRWVGPYLPTYKLEEGLDEVSESMDAAPMDYNLLVMDKRMVEPVLSRLQAMGVRAAAEKGSTRLVATLDGFQLAQVSAMDEVLFVDRVTELGYDLDMTRASSGVNELETLTGYAGQGVRGEVIDGGFRLTHEAFKANPLTAIQNSTDTAHGTGTASCTFGGGTAAGKNIGILTKATPFVMTSVSSRRAHAAEMVDPAKNYRIVFQSYSYGNTQVTNYTTVSADIDSILYDLDFAMFQSQSNTGNTSSRPEAWAKNVISIGGMDGKGTVNMADDTKSNASTGYAADGRIKPELAHYYTMNCATSTSDTSWAARSGTSFSTPASAGLGGLFYQMWADGVFDGGPGKNRNVFDSRPHASTARAILINTAKQWSFTTANSASRGRQFQGWGMIDAKGMYDVAKAHNWSLPILINETAPLAPQDSHSYTLNSDGTSPLRVTMVYRDPAGNPAATKARVNNLDLKITSPGGVVYWGNNGLKEGNWSVSGGAANDVDTAENVFVQSPEAGAWTVQVLGTEIVKDGNPGTPAVDAVYALVGTGGTSTPAPLAITRHPVSQTVHEGSSVIFSASAAGGTSPYIFQWLVDDVPVSGATSASYTFVARLTDNSKIIRVKVTDATGTTVISNPATLTVVEVPDVAPAITTEPADATVQVGQTATFRVAANGTPTPTYQWLVNGTPIAGATSASYTTPATTMADSGAKYSVTVTNRAGSATSRGALLTVTDIPSDVNLALKKPTTASSTYSGRPSSLAVDGVTTTRWSSKTLTATTKTQWLAVDLGTPQSVSRANILWGATYFASAWSVQYLNASNVWTTVWSTNNATAGRWQEVTFPAVTASQWRVHMTNNMLSNYTIYEVQLFSK